MEKIARAPFVPSIRDLAVEFCKMASDKAMKAWFQKRTDAHVARVQKYSKLIEAFDKKRFAGLAEQAADHDASKYVYPEREPYIRLSWKHKHDNYRGYKKPGTINDVEINQATLHHITNNKHHPEYWDEKAGPDSLNTRDRDAAPEKIVDGTKMPDMHIAEMVADWMAMAEELGKSVADWAKKNVNVRWKFNAQQVSLINELIENIPVVKGGS